MSLHSQSHIDYGVIDYDDIDIDGCNSQGYKVTGQPRYNMMDFDTPQHKSTNKVIDFQAWWNEGYQLFDQMRSSGEDPKLCDVLGALLIKKYL